MKKILIVDDNPNNRMLLHIMLDDYVQENPGCQLDIREAQNGVEAVDFAAETAFDIIFMDIMMPEMDGIEATRRIKQADKGVMIIAVSAVDDSERQKEILQNGAEDYISKPVSADIFLSRIGNYLALVESRKHKKKHSEGAVNLYTQEVFSRQLVFMVGNEDDLSEFWEYYLLNETNGCELLSDVVRTLYALGDVTLKFGLKIRIVMEESEEEMYFTLEGIEELDAKLIKLVLAKNTNVTDYKLEADRMSFRLEQSCVQDTLSVEPNPIPVVVENQAVEPEAVVAPEPVVIKKEETIEVYNYMDHDDLDEIRVYIGKLDSLLLLVGKGELAPEEIEEIYT